MEASCSILGNADRIRCGAAGANTLGHMDALPPNYQRKYIRFHTASRNCVPLGVNPNASDARWGVTFLTSFFLHAGVLHLIGNIYFLFVFGDDVENFLRPFRYLALIAFAALIGDLAHIAADPSSQIPCVGASGGIAGVIIFYALNFPEVKLGFLLRYGWWWFRWIRLRAWFVFVLWILFQAVGAWEQVAGISAVSSLAHIGGAVVGFVAWVFWRKGNRTAEISPS